FVKLDRALVQGLAEGSKSAPAILQLLQQTRASGVTIIAPYVEDADSLARLWNERVDLLQGNFLHGPDLHLAYDPVL
ncbi:MAG: EAL domain-containing protein, partial [Thioalkalivibrio sp.]|nr:EAL domain-containing protein [Thioalkalivibrio sp.]